MRASTTFRHPVGLAARVVSFLVTLKTVLQRRRLVGQMATFDDHMLRDIGLSRFDIESVLADPALTDPTHRLALRAHDARSNRRAAMLEQRQWAQLFDHPVDEPRPYPDRRAA